MRRLLPAFALLLALSSPLAIGPKDVPPPEDAGSFEGTWYYVDPGFRIAIFITRDAVGSLQIQYEVKSRSGVEYKTDEGGYARYLEGGNTIAVIFSGGAREPNLIEGLHQRFITTEKSSIEESGDFRIYRAEKGRKLVLHYPEYVTEVTDSAGRTMRSAKADVYRLFRKASDIILEFDEIRF